MALRLIVGRSGSGKTQRCVEEITAACESDPFGPPLIWLVPEQFSYLAEKSLLDAGKIQGYSRAQVLSFTRLADWVFARSPASRLPRLSQTHRELLATLIVTRERAENPDGFLNAQGLEEALSDFVSESKQYAVSSKQLREAAQSLSKRIETKTPQLSNLSRIKLEKLADLLDAFHKKAGQRFEDPQDTLTQLSDHIISTDLLQAAEIWIDGFAGFTPVEEKLLVALFQRAKRVNLALLADPDRTKKLLKGKKLPRSTVFLWTEETLSRIQKICHEAKVSLEEPEYLDCKSGKCRFNTKEARALEAGFDKRGAAFSDKPVHLRLIETKTPRDEARYAAEVAADWISRKGWNPGEIAIITRSLESYAAPLREALTLLRIPFFIDRSEPLETHPFITGLLAMMRAALRKQDTQSLIELGKSGLIAIGRRHVDALEHHATQYPRSWREWYADKNWTKPPDRQPSDDDHDQELPPPAFHPEVEKARRTIVQPVKRFLQRVAPAKQKNVLYRDFILGLCEFLRDTLGARELATEDEAILSRIGELFSEAIDVAGNEVMTLTLAGDLTSKVLSRLALPRIPPMLDHLTVGQIDRSRFPKLRGAIVLGMSEGLFPAILRNGSLLNDAERDALEEFGIDLKPSSTRQFAREGMLAYRALTAASDEIVVSRPRATESGSALSESPWWRDLVELFPEAKVAEVGEFLTAERSWRARELAAADLRLNLSSHLTGPIRSAATRITFAHEGAAGEAAQVLRAAAWRNEVQFSPELVREFYEGKLRLSASQLDTFGKCPYRHFVGYMLRPQEMLQPRFEYRDAGSFCHAILAKFTKALREEDLINNPPDELQFDALYDSAAQNIRDHMVKIGLTTKPSGALLLESLEEHLRILARWLIDAFCALGTRPVGEEVGIREKSEIPPLRLENVAYGWDVIVRGQIDRIDFLDEDGGWFFIVDYKLKQKKFDFDNWYGDENFQLPLYMLAVANSDLAKDHPKPGGGLYLEIVPKEDPDEEGEIARHYHGIAAASIYDTLFRGGFKWASTDWIKGSQGDPREKPRRWGTAVSDAELQAVMELTAERASAAAKQIIEGDCRIHPSRFGKFTACGWCDYRPVCQIDWQINKANQKFSPGRSGVLAELGDQSSEDRDG